MLPAYQISYEGEPAESRSTNDPKTSGFKNNLRNKETLGKQQEYSERNDCFRAAFQIF